MSVLSPELLQEFAKAVSPPPEKPKESSVYGTAKVEGDNLSVMIDGSEIYTPATAAVNVKDGDRVLVTFKARQAIITGNLTSDNSSTVYESEESQMPSVKTVHTGEWTDLLSFAGSAGESYLILYGAAFSTNATGYRQLHLGAASTSAGRYSPSYAAVTGEQTRIQAATVYTFTEDGTLYLWARQNSGSDLSVYAWMEVIKLKKE